MVDTSQSRATGSRPEFRPSGDTGADGGPAPLMNVWSRSGSKYRVRAIGLLALNVLLFAGVGCFAFWVRSGVVFAPAMDGYWDEIGQTFNFGRDTTVSLANLLVEPINIRDVPMQIPVIGLLMAALISIPILMSILYRFWSSVPFILVVGVLAVMPWLAITLLCSCIIASVRPFRARFRFMSALMGLVPIVVYLVLAWSGSAELVMGRIDPIDGMKFIAPWVLAIVAATLVFAVVLLIAKLVNYRPGTVAPLLAVMFGLPVGLFEFYVGRDELHYRLLESLNEAHFAEVDAAVGLREAALRTWDRHPLPRPRLEKVLEFEKQKWQFELALDLAPRRSELTQHQAELADRCDWFLKHFPASRYALNALYIKARALDMRVDPVEFREKKWIRFYDDFPNHASRATWGIILENRPDSVLSAVAFLKLAQLQAREGDVDRAVDKLAMILNRFAARVEPGTTGTSGTGTLMRVLERDTPEASLRIPLEPVLLEAQRLYDLLTENRDPLYAYEPISGPRRPHADFTFGLLDLDPRHEHYIENLQELKRRYPNCQIADNIDLEIAKATPLHVTGRNTARAVPPRRSKIVLLEACLKRFPSGDAVPEVLFRLGMACKADGQLVKSEEAFGRLLEEYPDSVWSRQAVYYTPRLGSARLTRRGR